MSIVASVKVYDGIVLGADSKTQLVNIDKDGNRNFIQNFDHATKLFQVEKHHIGILTYGSGNIGRRSVESFVIEGTRDLTDGDKQSVFETTKKLLRHFSQGFEEQYQGVAEDKKPGLGVFVAGYSGEKNSLAEEWEFNIPKDKKPKKVRPSEDFGASWRGISIPFTRMYAGLDPRIIPKLRNDGVPEEVISLVSKAAQEFKSPFVFDGMPIIDAITFCRFILETTVNMARFEPGVSSCGGPLDIAIITRSKGFEWVERKTSTIAGETES